MERPKIELADIIRRHQGELLARYGAHLTQRQRRALRDVAACRTASLGGQLWQCADCGQRLVVYHSWRNRHCPKCQAASRARWLAQQTRTLLPVAYFRMVFTLPAEVLFQAARETLVEVAADPQTQ